MMIYCLYGYIYVTGVIAPHGHVNVMTPSSGQIMVDYMVEQQKQNSFYQLDIYLLTNIYNKTKLKARKVKLIGKESDRFLDGIGEMNTKLSWEVKHSLMKLLLLWSILDWKLNCRIASKVKKIYGIDPSLATIDRAYRNAQENGISNCQFFQGYILDVLPELFKKLISEKNVVVITKPKRGGLKNSILNLLREFEPVKQIAYLSSKPDSINAISNFVHLSKAFRPADNVLGGHFNPITAIPVDLFPQTNHQELIFIFEHRKAFEPDIRTDS
uniref:Methyltransferase domain-containing protein n=1 Tax=Tetranychus urticae TaxID=32264 RepID=T1KHJ3_TETUR